MRFPTAWIWIISPRRRPARRPVVSSSARSTTFPISTASPGSHGRSGPTCGNDIRRPGCQSLVASRCALCSSFARGLQNKVLEAMAAGKPVVASTAACAGFGNRPDLPVCQCSQAAEWIATVSELLSNVEVRGRLSHAGRVYAETHHNWSNCLAPFRDLLPLSEWIAVGGGS